MRMISKPFIKKNLIEFGIFFNQTEFTYMSNIQFYAKP